MIEWMIPWWGWFLVGFALLLLELSSPGGFYFLFFGVGAISVGILAWLTVVEEAWVQLLFFSIFSIVTSVLFRKRLLARFAPKTGEANIDSLVGEAATVMDNIDADGFGKVELRGTAWWVDRRFLPGVGCHYCSGEDCRRRSATKCVHRRTARKVQRHTQCRFP